MERYIDADNLTEEIKSLSVFLSGNNVFNKTAKESVLRIIDEQPTAKVEEVKHAKWEINCDGYYPYCSNCKTEPENGVMSKRCPECGAKMDGKDINVPTRDGGKAE